MHFRSGLRCSFTPVLTNLDEADGRVREAARRGVGVVRQPAGVLATSASRI